MCALGASADDIPNSVILRFLRCRKFDAQRAARVLCRYQGLHTEPSFWDSRTSRLLVTGDHEANHVPPSCTVHLDSRSAVVGVEALWASSPSDQTPPPAPYRRGSGVANVLTLYRPPPRPLQERRRLSPALFEGVSAAAVWPVFRSGAVGVMPGPDRAGRPALLLRPKRWDPQATTLPDPTLEAEGD
eukprot:1180135-Prorocentrum_minimum.AAC.1